MTYIAKQICIVFSDQFHLIFDFAVIQKMESNKNAIKYKVIPSI